MKGGAIITGSLLWDNNPIRKNWRENTFCCYRRFRVYLPIRYGRKSTSRFNTFTMVFSQECYSLGLGIGWILPSKMEVKPFHIMDEAKKMAEAEGINCLCNSWGSVSLLLNPYKINKEASGIWSSTMSSLLANSPLLNTKLKTEKSAINSNGFLTIRWPKEEGPGGNLDDIDFLIATVTKPTIIDGQYPKPLEIATSMNNAKYYTYFENNRKNGIITFQDEEIEKMLLKNISNQGS